MDVSRYLSVLLLRWKLIAVFGVLGAFFAGALSVTSTPQYKATTTLFFYLSGGDSASQLLQGSTYAQNQVRSFALLAEQPVVLEPVIAKLGLQMTPQQLAGAVTTEVPLDTVVMDISVIDTNGAEAAAIANAIGAQMSTALGALSSVGNQNTAAVKVSTVAPATVPNYAFSPNSKLNVVIGLILGLAIGVVVAVVRALTDNRVGSAEVVKALTLVPVIGEIPVASDADRFPLAENSKQAARAEAFRRLATNFDFISYDDRIATMAVTSSTPDEGKSAVALNLAVALSSSLKVVLIDADMRRPTIARLTDLDWGIGLSTVLTGKVRLDQALQPWHRGQLQVLPAGPIPPNSAELLGSDSLKQLLETLKETADLVIIDTPPLLPASDAAVLSRVVDGTLMVVDAKRTRRRQLTDSLEILALAGGKVVGIVLNKSMSKKIAAYGEYTAKSKPPTKEAS